MKLFLACLCHQQLKQLKTYFGKGLKSDTGIHHSYDECGLHMFNSVKLVYYSVNTYEKLSLHLKSFKVVNKTKDYLA